MPACLGPQKLTLLIPKVNPNHHTFPQFHAHAGRRKGRNFMPAQAVVMYDPATLTWWYGLLVCLLARFACMHAGTVCLYACWHGLLVCLLARLGPMHRLRQHSPRRRAKPAQAAARHTPADSPSDRCGPTAALGPRHACGAGAHNQYLAALGPVMPAALGPLHACVAGNPKTHPSPTPNAILTLPAAAAQAPCVMYTPAT